MTNNSGSRIADATSGRSMLTVGSLIGSSRNICRCEIIEAAAARYAENATKLSQMPDTRPAESLTARSSAPMSKESILLSAMVLHLARIVEVLQLSRAHASIDVDTLRSHGLGSFALLAFHDQSRVPFALPPMNFRHLAIAVLLL